MDKAKFFVYETVDIPLVFTPTGVLEQYSKIVVSMAQFGETIIEKWQDDLGIDVANDIIHIHLNQKETSLFKGGKKGSPKLVDIQVNLYYENEERDTTFNETIEVYDNQHKEVITNE